MNISTLLSDFATELAKRTGILTEDGVRYYLFAQMLKQDDDLNHYTLEQPYGAPLAGKEEMDIYYDDGKDSICIELKFHRCGTASSAFAHTDAAGSLFNDLRRLQAFVPFTTTKPVRRLLVYVTDDEMHKYLSVPSTTVNPIYRKALKSFYDLSKGTPITFSDGGFGTAPKTFLDSASATFPPAPTPFSVPVQSVYQKDFAVLGCPSLKGRNCHIRAYEVL